MAVLHRRPSGLAPETEPRGVQGHHPGVRGGPGRRRAGRGCGSHQDQRRRGADRRGLRRGGHRHRAADHGRAVRGGGSEHHLAWLTGGRPCAAGCRAPGPRADNAPAIRDRERLPVLEFNLLTDWTLRLDPDGPTPDPDRARPLSGRVLDVRVPGAVHGDLLDAGLIPDPFLDDQEFEVAWVSRTDWVYECTAPAPPGHERVDLVFDGLDTVAVVEVDGVVVGRSRNMHRSYRYDVTSLLTGAPPHVAVHLSSAYTEAEAERARLGPRPNAYPEPFNYIRKMACSFGWDWGPTVVGAGIWRPARWEAWSTARIARLRPLVDVVGRTGLLQVLLDVER